ncbi:MAG: TrkH family potassium uptake protein [Cohaesibacteraceae bacterium]|nr:TrkH family potassium uptake protein [Cohaesibacteraceae bacterium]
MTATFFYLSLCLGLLGGLMLPVAGFAISIGDDILAREFILLSGLTGFIAGGVFFSLRGRVSRPGNAQGFVLCVLCWTILPVIAAIPISHGAQVSFIDGLFEAMSGFTTTGATIFRSLDPLPQPLVLWRAILQWYGGFLTLMGILLILSPAGVGGIPTRQLGLGDKRGIQDPRSVMAIATQIAWAYSLATLLIIWMLIVSGLPGFDAFCLALSGISNGGFMPRDGTLEIYGSASAELILMVAMLFGATSIFWHRMLYNLNGQHLLEHRESYYVVGLSLLIGFIYAVSFFRLAGGSAVLEPIDALREGFLTSISIITTTGYEARSAGSTVLPILLVLPLLFIGGSIFSTSGGMSMYRLGAMLVQAGREVARLVYPHSIRGSKFGSQHYDIQLMKAIWSYFLIAVLTVSVFSALLGLLGMSFEPSLTATITMFTNAGPFYATGWSEGQDWPHLSELHPVQKLTLLLTMLAGRLDVIVLFGAVNLTFWRQ